ncbi:DUF4595 domain-containing protein [Niabella aurantiaca]|uniref:DUF4595 domain-containing protein n=1 Tax=Niabella aurantiaca TaxID=379900 RepID=UPI00035D63AE|nr:DUF4595 domain-containing protein [Niabella aurantiaca]
MSFLYTFLLWFVLPSGWKQHTSSRQPACCIVNLRYSFGDAYRLDYDTIGRLETVTRLQGNFINRFLYRGDTVIAESFIDGLADEKTIYVINRNGLVTWAREGKTDGSTWHIRIFEYDGMQLRKVTHTDYLGAAYTSYEVYTWRNGNPVKIAYYDARKKPDGVNTFQYYEDQASRPGDYWSETALLTGMRSLQPKNLLKSISGPETTRISYVFDSKGKITGMKEAEDWDTRTCMYQYKCN